jgi:hypothetical protein
MLINVVVNRFFVIDAVFVVVLCCLLDLVLNDFMDRFSFDGIASYLIEPIYDDWIEKKKKRTLST